LLVDFGEPSKRHRRVVSWRIEPSFVEGAIPDRGGQLVQGLVGLRLRSDLAVRPLRQAYPLATKAAPPCMLAAVASTSLVLADLVQTHRPFLLPSARCQAPPSIEPPFPE